jgi:hypothetical protein
MAELKTKLNAARVEGFLNKIADENRRKDCFAIMKLMKSAAKAEPKMWGAAIVGFGEVHLKYESGRELDWFQFGFSPRKQNLTLYGVMNASKSADLLKKLGKHKTGKGCLYINSLDEINVDVLKKMLEIAAVKKKLTAKS